MIINILEIPVFYINLKKERIKDRQTRETLNGLGFKDIRRFDAILGKDKTQGCAMSHQAILKEIDIDGPFIVFEDDIDVNDSFNPIIDVPEDADAVYLGLSMFALNGITTEEDLIADRVNDSVYRIYNMLAAHSILYIKKDYYKFISKAIDAMLNAEPLSQLKSCRNQDNARAETMKYFNIYALNHPLFYQGGKHRVATRFDLDKVTVRSYKKKH
jgi:GR25 family glycosyltransferase involved in LPS biosynthesis